jgi:hypothetical protein
MGNYFYHPTDEQPNIIISFKGGLLDVEGSKSADNYLCCHSCFKSEELGYLGGASARDNLMKCVLSHVCKVKQVRKKRRPDAVGGFPAGSLATSRPDAVGGFPVVSVREDPYEAMLSDMLENPRFSRVRDTISQFYDEAEDEDTPATTGIDFLLELLKFVGASQKALQQTQAKAEERFATERERHNDTVSELETTLGCLRTELHNNEQQRLSLSKTLCEAISTKVRLVEENDRLKAELKALKNKTE